MKPKIELKTIVLKEKVRDFKISSNFNNLFDLLLFELKLETKDYIKIGKPELIIIPNKDGHINFDLEVRQKVRNKTQDEINEESKKYFIFLNKYFDKCDIWKVRLFISHPFWRIREFIYLKFWKIIFSFKQILKLN